MTTQDEGDYMKIVELDRTKYEKHELDLGYETKGYYRVRVKGKHDTTFTIKKRRFLRKRKKTVKAHLFADYIDNPEVFAIFERKKIAAVIEGSVESWNGRYRIWNILVERKFRRRGYGQSLIKHIKKRARKSGSRAIVLEVQSCNVSAISFYFNQGFRFTGIDIMAYTNQDIKKKEVRLEMGLYV